MHLDYWLFAIGGVFLLASLILGCWLFLSRKRAKAIRMELENSSTVFDAVTVTAEALNDTAMLEKTQRRTKSDTTVTLHETDFLTVPMYLNGESSQDIRTAEPQNLDISPLNGRYVLESELGGGGMSRVFIARHAQLGNQWLVKYTPQKTDSLANEKDTLTQLNHVGLPKITDVFYNNEGTFLVESFIEGYPMDVVLKNNRPTQALLINWATQLAQVLRYLHQHQDGIVHCDMKPANVMVTYDNKLVLIDFGISHRSQDGGQSYGLSVRYAAPEQFTVRSLRILNEAGQKILQERFQNTDFLQYGWKISPKTDIYSFGVILFEAATGDIPHWDDEGKINMSVSPELAEIILKCIRLNPDERYASAEELLTALEALQNIRLKQGKSMILRKIAGIGLAGMLVMSFGTGTAGAYYNQLENQSIVSMQPGGIVISEQQNATIHIFRTRPNGKTTELDCSDIQWSFSGENIVRLDGNRILGINEGETTVYGKYRNHWIELHATVTAASPEMTEISLMYQGDRQVAAYSGGTAMDWKDGELDAACFVSPGSLVKTAEGMLVIADSGKLRMIEAEQVSTLQFQPAYITPQYLTTDGVFLYFAANAWSGEDGTLYWGIVRLRPDGSEPVFLFYEECAFTKVHDITTDNDGNLLFIQENLASGTWVLRRIDTENGDCTPILELPEETCCVATDEEGSLYFGNRQDGAILVKPKESDTLQYFAGVSGERDFIDGDIARFFCPTRIHCYDRYLYVWDYDVLRRITIQDGAALFTETIAGSPTNNAYPDTSEGDALQVNFAAGEQTDFLRLSDHRILITDPKHGYIWEVTEGY